MTSDPRLETYLSSLERVLKPFSVSDRAEIVTEIKSHVLSALEREPNSSIDTILAALGEPELVANRYLIERGVKPTKPPISPIVKWLVIGFLGTFAMFLTFVGIMIFKFSPILKMNGPNEKIALLGGMIEVDKDTGNFFLNDLLQHSYQFEGQEKWISGQSIEANFANGKFEITNSGSDIISWKCAAKGGAKHQSDKILSKSNNNLVLNLDQYAGVKCDLEIPRGARFKIQGANGKIKFDEPRYGVDVELSNGKVEIKPDESVNYKYSLAVSNGKIDSFVSSDKADAYLIKINLSNGKISKESE